MTTDLGAFPDAEATVMAWLVQQFPDLAPEADGTLHVISVGAPGNGAWEPLVRVSGRGGADDLVTDRTRVDIEVFGRSRAVAYDRSEAIRARLLGAPHRVNSVVIDRVRTETKPFRAPWADTGVHRFMATYVLSARR